MKTKDLSKIKKEDFQKWLYNKSISPYYVTLSDFAKKYIDDFDIELYRPSITPEIEEFYNKEFNENIR